MRHGPLLLRHLENDFQLDRGSERKARDTIHQAARVLVFPEDVLQQLRSGVGDLRVVAEVSRSGDRDAEPDGAELELEAGRKAARLAALNVLAVAREHLGSLDKVMRVGTAST